MPQSEAFILEESIVDPVEGVMTTKTRNLSHARIMSVEETQTYKRSCENNQW